MDTERLIDKDALQEQLDIVEQRLLWIAGTLRVLDQLRVVIPKWVNDVQVNEVQERLDHAGEAMDAVLKVKEELGLHSSLKKTE